MRKTGMTTKKHHDLDHLSGTLVTGAEADRVLADMDKVDYLPTPCFHIVLVAPEIPQNTGTIGRLCVCTGARLHLIKPRRPMPLSRSRFRMHSSHRPHLSVTPDRRPFAPRPG